MSRCATCTCFLPAPLHPEYGFCSHLATELERRHGVRLAGAPAVRRDSPGCADHSHPRQQPGPVCPTRECGPPWPAKAGDSIKGGTNFA